MKCTINPGHVLHLYAFIFDTKISLIESICDKSNVISQDIHID